MPKMVVSKNDTPAWSQKPNGEVPIRPSTSMAASCGSTCSGNRYHVEPRQRPISAMRTSYAAHAALKVAARTQCLEHHGRREARRRSARSRASSGPSAESPWCLVCTGVTSGYQGTSVLRIRPRGDPRIHRTPVKNECRAAAGELPATPGLPLAKQDANNKYIYTINKSIHYGGVLLGL